MLPVNLKFNGRPVTFSDSGGALPSGFTVKPVQGTSLAVHWPGRRLRGLIVQPFLAVHCHGHCAPRRTGSAPGPSPEHKTRTSRLGRARGLEATPRAAVNLSISESGPKRSGRKARRLPALLARAGSADSDRPARQREPASTGLYRPLSSPRLTRPVLGPVLAGVAGRGSLIYARGRRPPGPGPNDPAPALGSGGEATIWILVNRPDPDPSRSGSESIRIRVDPQPGQSGQESILIRADPDPPSGDPAGPNPPPTHTRPCQPACARVWSAPAQGGLAATTGTGARVDDSNRCVCVCRAGRARAPLRRTAWPRCR